MTKLLTPEEVCKMLNICRRTLTRWDEQGKIRHVKFNKRVFRYKEEEVEKAIEKLVEPDEE